MLTIKLLILAAGQMTTCNTESILQRTRTVYGLLLEFYHARLKMVSLVDEALSVND